MFFVGIAYFKPNSQREQYALEAAFTDHLSQPLNPRIRLGGAILDARGEPSGVLLVLDTDSIETARNFLAASPYQTNGLYERVEINAVRLQIGHL